MRRLGLPLIVASLVAAFGLVGVVWFDYAATRSELVGLLREQALALRETVVAAARSNRAASAFAATQLGERLLDQARALAALDGQGRLTAAALEDVTRRNPLLRVGVFAADGSREDLGAATASASEPAGRGPRGGWGRRGGMGEGGPPPPRPGPGGPGRGLRGGGVVVRQILQEGRAEVVTGVHSPRWGTGERVAAGVKRARGGAIVVTVDATQIASLEQPITPRPRIKPPMGHSRLTCTCG